MSEPNKGHLKILADAVGLKVIREDEINHTIKIKDALAAMQILQNRIDELEKENERLKKGIQIGIDINTKDKPVCVEYKLRELKNPKNPE